MKGDYEKFATENMGIFRIGGVNCDQHAQICEKEKIETFPLVRLYPEFPAPHIDFPITEKFDGA